MYFSVARRAQDSEYRVLWHPRLLTGTESQWSIASRATRHVPHTSGIDPVEPRLKTNRKKNARTPPAAPRTVPITPPTTTEGAPAMTEGAPATTKGAPATTEGAPATTEDAPPAMIQPRSGGPMIAQGETLGTGGARGRAGLARHIMPPGFHPGLSWSRGFAAEPGGQVL
jgi:hypothetical protein